MGRLQDMQAGHVQVGAAMVGGVEAHEVSSSGSQDLAALVANPHLVAVLVRCCSPADRKTCKRALQVGVRSVHKLQTTAVLWGG
jgi:flagellar biosynthesis/type III secretory pathway ATPase